MEYTTDQLRALSASDLLGMIDQGFSATQITTVSAPSSQLGISPGEQRCMPGLAILAGKVNPAFIRACCMCNACGGGAVLSFRKMNCPCSSSASTWRVTGTSSKPASRRRDFICSAKWRASGSVQFDWIMTFPFGEATNRPSRSVRCASVSERGAWRACNAAVARSASDVLSSSALSNLMRSSAFRASVCFLIWSARSLTVSVTTPRADTKIASPVWSLESASNESHQYIYDLR